MFKKERKYLYCIKKNMNKSLHCTYEYKKRKIDFIIFTCKNMKRNKKVYNIFFLNMKKKRIYVVFI